MKKPKKFAVIDAETDPFEFGADIQPFLWGFYDGEQYLEFKDTEELAYHVSEFDGFVYAHNGGKFDYHFLLPWIDRGEILVIDGRLSKMKLGMARLRDSWNILPIPLSAYQKDEIDYSWFKPDMRDKPHIRKHISQYLMGDCRYTYDLVAAFVGKHGHKLTQAGASLALFTTMTGKSFPTNNERGYFELFKPFYYGGRVQCFESGIIDTPVKVFDINSAYPTAMLDEHPYTRDYTTIESATAALARKYPYGFFEFDAPSRGAFPWRTPDGIKLLFPADGEVRRFMVTGWEVVAAMDTGVLDEDAPMVRVMAHSELTNFKDYILPLYDERKRCKAVGDKAGDLLAKLAMNSLYGKTGTDGRKHTKAELLDYSDDAMALLMLGHYAKGDRLYHSGGQPDEDTLLGISPVREDEMTFYNVATAASITGWVRAFLWRSLCQVERPLYCDTDSIICEDGADLDTGNQLGHWKLEGEFTRAAIAGRKLYALTNDKGEEKTASKGARLTVAEIETVAKGQTVAYKKDSPSYSLRFGRRYIERKISKTI